MVGVELGSEDGTTVPGQPLQMEVESADSSTLDPHRGEMSVVGEREWFDVLRPGMHLVSFLYLSHRVSLALFRASGWRCGKPPSSALVRHEGHERSFRKALRTSILTVLSSTNDSHHSNSTLHSRQARVQWEGEGAAIVNESAPAGTRIPGYGWQEWPPERLDEVAHRLLSLHLPDPDLTRQGTQECLYCGRPWQCAEVRWSLRQLNVSWTAWRRWALQCESGRRNPSSPACARRRLRRWWSVRALLPHR